MAISRDDLMPGAGICARGNEGAPDVTLVLRSGHKLRSSSDAEVLVADDAGPRWVRAADVQVGAFVAVRYGGHAWPDQPPAFGSFEPPAAHGSQRTFTRRRT